MRKFKVGQKYTLKGSVYDEEVGEIVGVGLGQVHIFWHDANEEFSYYFDDPNDVYFLKNDLVSLPQPLSVVLNMFLKQKGDR